MTRGLGNGPSGRDIAKALADIPQREMGRRLEMDERTITIAREVVDENGDPVARYDSDGNLVERYDDDTEGDA